jgi:hypothetical protein
MKVGDRDTPGTRIYAEREFREDCQVLVATEAAGEGINLQFCWYMINYDIPWNPNRLEQRMGRIHRYGQERDCLIANFVSTNTREGRVLEKLFERIRQIELDLDPDRTGKVFNVIGEVFPSNQLERMLREMYARNLTEDVIKDRIVTQVDTGRLREITESTLEGLAKRELNLSAIVGKAEEAKERRLVPEVVEDFFVQAAPLAGMSPQPDRTEEHAYRVGRVPRILMPYGRQLEPRFGRLGREYGRVAFDKELLTADPTLEWVTPGHPLFESVRALVTDKARNDLERGAVFYDLHRPDSARLDLYSAEIRDGRGQTLHKRLFVIETTEAGAVNVRQPTIFLDLAVAPAGADVPGSSNLSGSEEVEIVLYEQALQPLLDEQRVQREKEIKTISEHMEVSLNTIIDRVQLQFSELIEQKQSGSHEAGLDGRIRMLEDRLDELNGRLEGRRAELEQEQHCTISHIEHLGSAWVLPHPERETPIGRAMVSDPVIEAIAVREVIEFEESRGWSVESVELENRGFDLISRKPHPDDSDTAIEVRFIEVKGRAQIGEVALTSNEYKTAERLKDDYWLYVVFNCASKPDLHLVHDPARLGWKPVVMVEHYHVGANEILAAETRDG